MKQKKFWIKKNCWISFSNSLHQLELVLRSAKNGHYRIGSIIFMILVNIYIFKFFFLITTIFKDFCIHNISLFSRKTIQLLMCIHVHRYSGKKKKHWRCHHCPTCYFFKLPHAGCAKPLLGSIFLLHDVCCNLSFSLISKWNYQHHTVLAIGRLIRATSQQFLQGCSVLVGQPLLPFFKSQSGNGGFPENLERRMPREGISEAVFAQYIL